MLFILLVCKETDWVLIRIKHRPCFPSEGNAPALTFLLILDKIFSGYLKYLLAQFWICSFISLKLLMT